MDDFNESLPVKPSPDLSEARERSMHPYESTRQVDSGVSSLPRLVGLLVLLSLVAIAPFLAGQFQYHLTSGRMRAEVEVATEVLGTTGSRLEDFVLASRMVAKRMSPSVVSVHRADRGGREGQGSGVIVDESGYIVTNEHVVRGASGLHVRLIDGRVADAVLIGSDPQIDVAVIKIAAGDLVAAEWGDSDKMDVGDLVWAVGSPYGLECSVTFGIVSAKNRRSTSGVTESLYQEFLQTDVAINPGNSGGPLVDLGGKVVGINTMIVGERYAGISFSVPSNLARETYESLLENGIIERGYLGVMPQEVPPAVRNELSIPAREGVFVGLVESPSPAARAGLQVGDVILKWNDGIANDPTLLSREIAATPIGTNAVMTIKRKDGGVLRELKLTVTVGGRPQPRLRSR